MEAVSPGMTVVTAAVAGQPSVEASANVAVVEAEPMVEFEGLTKDGEPANPAEIAGLLQALAVDLGGAVEGTVELPRASLRHKTCWCRSPVPTRWRPIA